MGMVDVRLIHGDCLEVMQGMEPNSISSIVTDPPYGYEFMGANWDRGVPGVAFWEAALRVAKPGAMLLAFGGTRTHHRLMVAIEDAGWQIRDVCMYLYGSGFPKSHDISKAIDKAAGEQRERIRGVRSGVVASTYAQDKWSLEYKDSVLSPEPITDAARQWDGWGTALKPAWEPIIMAMKPLDGTYANNALVHGVAGLNIDASRIEAGQADDYGRSTTKANGRVSTSRHDGWKAHLHGDAPYTPSAQGRWPANLLLDEEAAAMLDQMSGASKSVASTRKKAGLSVGNGVTLNRYQMNQDNDGGYNDQGGASRFFARFAHDEEDAPLRFAYCAKASKRDRDEGLEGMEKRGGHLASREGGGGGWAKDAAKNPNLPRANHHPCVKPTALMRYLVRLVTPSGGTVLDPFMGSGSTGKAAVLEGFNFIGIDTEAEYLAIAERRIAHALATAEKPRQAQPALLEVA